MKKLAYFLVLSMGITAYAAEVAAPAPVRGRDPTPSSGNMQGEAYTQMMHWRTFVVFYMARCSRSDSGEVGQYVTNIGGFLQKNTPMSQAAESFLNKNGIHRVSGGGGGEGSAYGSYAADKCGTELANRYEQLYHSQGESSFCGANRAKYQDLLGDKNVESVKQKALSTVSSDPGVFSAGICSPQSSRVSIQSAPLPAPAPRQAAAYGGNGYHSTPAPAAQSAPASGGAENISPPAGAIPTQTPAGTQLSGSATAGGTPAPNSTTGNNDTQLPGSARPQAAGTRRSRPTPRHRDGAIVAASTTQDSADDTAKEEKPAAAPAKKADTETASVQTQSASIQAPLNTPQNRALFKVADGSCDPKIAASDVQRNRFAHVDAIMQYYTQNCNVSSKDPRMEKFTGPYTTEANGFRDQFKTKAIQSHYDGIERNQDSKNHADYCKARTSLYNSIVNAPSNSRINDFINSENFCK